MHNKPRSLNFAKEEGTWDSSFWHHSSLVFKKNLKKFRIFRLSREVQDQFLREPLNIFRSSRSSSWRSCSSSLDSFHTFPLSVHDKPQINKCAKTNGIKKGRLHQKTGRPIKPSFLRLWIDYDLYNDLSTMLRWELLFSNIQSSASILVHSSEYYGHISA